MGHPGWVLSPLVVGPTRMPVLTSVARAADAPELAVLSAIAHSDDTRVLDTFADALEAIDVERARLYADYVIAALPEAARKYLEGLMVAGTHEYQSGFARKYVAEGRAEGRAESVLAVLAARGIAVSDEQRARISACTDLKTLDVWIRRAAVVASATDLFD